MKNTAVKTKRKYEKKLAKVISKSGIELIVDDQEITAVIIAEPKGLYAVDNFDLDLIIIEYIMQEVSTGKVMAHNQEFGTMNFTFDFIGSREECYKFLLDEKESNTEAIARLNITVNRSSRDERQ